MSSKSIELPQGVLRYRDVGEGEPLVFLHGLLVDGLLWRHVIAELRSEFRCIAPDLPLGAHRQPMLPDADLAPIDVARMVADLIEALELENVTLVGNDTGGAIAQLVAAWHPKRIGRLALTPCDAYENFLPPMFRYLQVVARIPFAPTILMQSMRIKRLRRMPFGFGWLSKRLPDDVLDDWLQPAIHDSDVRRDAVKFLRAISTRTTIEAAERLRDFDRPVLLAWAPEDRNFRLCFAERLASDLPNARLERIEDSYTFVSEDQPEQTAELIRGFVTAE